MPSSPKEESNPRATAKGHFSGLLACRPSPIVSGPCHLGGRSRIGPSPAAKRHLRPTKGSSVEGMGRKVTPRSSGRSCGSTRIPPPRIPKKWSAGRLKSLEPMASHPPPAATPPKRVPPPSSNWPSPFRTTADAQDQLHGMLWNGRRWTEHMIGIPARTTSRPPRPAPASPHHCQQQCRPDPDGTPEATSPKGVDLAPAPRNTGPSTVEPP